MQEPHRPSSGGHQQERAQVLGPVCAHECIFWVLTYGKHRGNRCLSTRAGCERAERVAHGIYFSSTCKPAKFDPHTHAELLSTSWGAEPGRWTADSGSENLQKETHLRLKVAPPPLPPHEEESIIKDQHQECVLAASQPFSVLQTHRLLLGLLRMRTTVGCGRLASFARELLVVTDILSGSTRKGAVA